MAKDSSFAKKRTHRQEVGLARVVKVEVEVAVPLQRGADGVHVGGAQQADAGVQQVALGAADARRGAWVGQHAGAAPA